MIKVDGIEHYTGGKAGDGVYQAVINEIRPHDYLIIPFLGNCAIMRHIKKAELTVGMDLDTSLVAKWQAMEFSDIKIHCQDGIEYLDRLPLNIPINKKVAIYCDPPYPISSRKGQRELYRHELTDEQHLRLLQILKKINRLSNANGMIPIDILISTYPNKLYENELEGWRLKTYQAQTRRGRATEHLYMNFKNDEGILHDYSFVGECYRQRERIKKKITRHVNRLLQLPASERNAIIHAIKTIEP